jgi:hypothetical protein
MGTGRTDEFRKDAVRNAGWLGRIGGLRANTSRLSHAELDSAEEIDESNPGEFSFMHQPFLRSLPNLRVIGGCCGTDHRHIGALSTGLLFTRRCAQEADGRGGAVPGTPIPTTSLPPFRVHAIPDPPPTAP